MKITNLDRAFYTTDELAERLGVDSSMVQQFIWVDQALRPAVQLRSNVQRKMPYVQLWRRSLDWSIFEYPLGKFENVQSGWVYLDLAGAALYDQSAALAGPGSCIGVLDTHKRSHHKAYGPIRFHNFEGQLLEPIFQAQGEGRHKFEGDELVTAVNEFWLELEAELVVPLEEVRRFEGGAKPGTAPQWKIKADVDITGGYSAPLLAFMEGELAAGRPPPKAAHVMAAWRDKLPAELIEVRDREIVYHGSGEQPRRTATSKAISQAIKRRLVIVS